ncbi:PREDICTED: uncharacterized protein LOC109328254 [Lupinus angustifolius]|uniref:uncharacterized protein LOC109328254 n=1 Tax=Lupinus angustifolius TaxID=3871 RepID=UPI00092E650E|nr:PREDICTED: uncharacterized protein LOC109328254 [Lupinus angustifolius]
MGWHALESNKDGLIRHPRYGEAWKTFDLMHPDFASDPRNVRLGLATDGFNPFRTLSSTYSVWLVFLTPYNLPPWMCMKHTSFILSMTILGKHTPGNNIDVYLRSLVEELKELWNDGVETFDSSSNETFRMRAALMWTISDFPSLGILSGWNTHTGLACPTCNFDAEPCRLPHSSKWCFMGHRRFLSRNHKLRLIRARFDGSTEERNPPSKLSGSDIFRQVENINVTFGKGAKLNGTGKRSREEPKQWNKRSIFFELPYWEFNLLRHCLDFMHIEKNIFDNIIYTLLHDRSKSKDNLKARKDLREMGIRSDLWSDDNDRYNLALFSLTRDNKKLFLKILKSVTVPDGYASNISRCVDEEKQKIYGLKSHDCHIIMEQLLPLAIRNLLPNHVTAILVEFSSFFRVLCEEARLEGPVQYRYMYPVERELGHLKSFVRNMAQPEGSIAESYLAEESLNFCSRYIEDIETRFNRPRRVCDDPSDKEPLFVSSIFPQIMNPDTINSMSTGLKFLARGPLDIARRFTTYNINGFKFRTLAREEGMRMQNSGVFLTSNTSCISSSVDGNIRQADLPYYGKLEDIIEINYYGYFRVILFKCRWADTTRDRGYKKDSWNFNCVNFDRLIHNGDREEHEPYIEASQAQMVYYVDDVVNKGWNVAVHLKARDLYDMGEEEQHDAYENESYQEQNLDQFFTLNDEYVQLATNHVIDDIV